MPKRWSSTHPFQLETELSEIKARVEERHTENLRRLNAIDATLQEIRQDVQSLLTSRSYFRGVWKAAGIVGGIVAAAFELVSRYFK